MKPLQAIESMEPPFYLTIHYWNHRQYTSLTPPVIIKVIAKGEGLGDVLIGNCETRSDNESLCVEYSKFGLILVKYIHVPLTSKFIRWKKVEVTKEKPELILQTENPTNI